MDEEQKFKLRIFMNKFQVFIFYFFREPYYEAKALAKGSYNSTLLFWLAIFVTISLKLKNIGGWQLNLAVAIILIAYMKMFWESNKWKEYYQKEYVEGKNIENEPEL